MSHFPAEGRLETPPPTEIVVVEDKREDRESIVAAFCAFVDRDHIAEFPGEEATRDFVAHLANGGPPAHKKALRLILLDFHLDGHTVLPLLTHLRASTATRDTPTVIFSDSNDPHQIRRCYEYGANAFVVKPIDYQTFAGAVRSIATFWLGNHKVLRG